MVNESPVAVNLPLEMIGSGILSPIDAAHWTSSAERHPGGRLAQRNDIAAALIRKVDGRKEVAALDPQSRRGITWLQTHANAAVLDLHCFEPAGIERHPELERRHEDPLPERVEDSHGNRTAMPGDIAAERLPAELRMVDDVNG